MPQKSKSQLAGVINLMKPVGITSAKALYKVRAICGQRKSGHAGTLDPGASGVLMLCLGAATKLVESFMDLPKVYTAVARLDVTSESYDSDRPLTPVDVQNVPGEGDVVKALSSFEGTCQQVPPDISAVKVNGLPAYKYGLDEDRPQLKARPVRIYWTQVQRLDWPELQFQVCCGRGTYIRSIVRDLGKILSSGGCLTELHRNRIGPFDSKESWTLESLAGARDSSEYVIGIESVKRIIEPVAVPPRPDACALTEPQETGD